jgi:phosphate transport system permease protein
LGEAVKGGDHYRVLFVIGLVLFFVTFAVNLTADLIVKGIRHERSA